MINDFFFFENLTVYEIMRKKYRTAGQATHDNTTRCIRITCWIATATDTHSEYVIYFAFPLWQWLHERASILRYTCIACFVYPLKTKHVYFI